MDRETHQLEISIGAHTLPAARAAYDLREGEEVDRSAFLRLLRLQDVDGDAGNATGLPALPPWSRLRVAEIRHLFWDDVDQLLHTVSVRLERAAGPPAAGPPAADPPAAGPPAAGPPAAGPPAAGPPEAPADRAQPSAPAAVGSSQAST